MKTKIDKGIPIPAPRVGVTQMLRDLMQGKKGDSVFIPDHRPNMLSQQKVYAGIKSGDVIARSEGNGCRVWKAK